MLHSSLLVPFVNLSGKFSKIKTISFDAIKSVQSRDVESVPAFGES